MGIVDERNWRLTVDAGLRYNFLNLGKIYFLPIIGKW